MIKKSLIRLQNIIRVGGVQKNVHYFARVTQGQAKNKENQFKEKVHIKKVNDAKEEFINQKNEFSDEQNISQNYILNSNNLERLFDVYSHFKDQMNIINYATCLNQAIKLTKDKDYSLLLEKYGGQIKEVCDYLECNIQHMKGFSASNYLSNIVRLNLHTPQLIDKVSNLIVDHNWHFNTTQTSFLIWSLANSKSRNDKYLKYASKNLQNIRSIIKPQDLANIFMGLGKLKYIDEDLTIYLEAQIYRSSQQFSLNVRDLFDSFVCLIQIVCQFNSNCIKC